MPYWLSKSGKYLQRMTVQVGFGLCLILASHWWPDPGEREWLREVGGAISGFAFVWWLNGQARRRVNERGKLLRTPTIRISPEKAKEIQDHLESRDGR